MFKKILYFLLCLTVAIPIAALSVSADSVTKNYSDFFREVVNKGDTAFTTPNVNVYGENALKVVPNPGAVENSIILDAWGLTSLDFDLTKYKYVIVDYYYDSSKPSVDGEMTILLLATKGPLSTGVTVNSNEKLVTRKWARATFTIGSKVKSVLRSDFDSPNLFQLHFYPYGKETKNTALTKKDVMYIGNFTFTDENPNKDAEFTVTFSAGARNVTGEEKVVSAKAGTEIVLPESPFVHPDEPFRGWIYGSDTSKVYKPGDKYTVIDENVVFNALWEDTVSKVPSTAVIEYANYYGGIADKAKHPDVLAFEDTDYTGKDGIRCVVVSPNPKAESLKNIVFDGWRYQSANVMMRDYKYAAMVYKLETENDYEPIKPMITISTLGGAVSLTIKTEGEALIPGNWNMSLFDLNAVNKVAGNAPIRQIHLRPIGKKDITTMSEKDKISVAYLLFMKDKPTYAAVHNSFITGYADGSFGISGTMTRAEACTVVTRLLTQESLIKGKYKSSFADVDSSAWYYDNIAFLENRGYLKSYSGSFEPNKSITRAEFVELIYNLGLLSDKGANGVFTDVPENHPRAQVIAAAGKAGLVNGYANGDGTFSFKPENTITRTEVVKVINNAFGKKTGHTDEMSIYDEVPLYSDLSKDFWGYTDIMEASITHFNVQYEEETEKWVYANLPDGHIDYAAGEAKLSEVGALTDKRISEIRESSSIETQGNVYYISDSTGDDGNDGRSPETAWKSLRMAENTKIVSGDTVLFKRGDLWRGGFTTRSGVLYSAYGEGEKPKIYLSPENGSGGDKWELVEGTDNIWKFYKQLVDVGGVVYNDGEGVFEKLTMYLDNGVYYYDSALSKRMESPAAALNAWEDMTCFNDQKSPEITSVYGDFYVRCDKGNPGVLYESLEFIYGPSSIIQARSNVTIDNLCIKYGARHGISGGSTDNLKVTNCEIGFIGGGIQGYDTTGGLKVKAHAGRYGNGIEIYGSCNGYVIENCYVYNCYDAGMTHQFSAGGVGSCIEENVRFTNNVITDCCYGIEYFMGSATTNELRIMKDVEFSGNIIRRAGYGFGRRGAALSDTYCIRSGSIHNQSEGFVISNNILDRSKGALLDIRAEMKSWIPQLSGNTYIQNASSNFVLYGKGNGELVKGAAYSAHFMAETVKDKDGKVYFIK